MGRKAVQSLSACTEVHFTYVVGQLSSRTRHRVFAVAALDKSLKYGVMTLILAFLSCIVDLWQSLSEWHLLMSACFLMCRRENIGA